jgi:hypothetical protein
VFTVTSLFLFGLDKRIDGKASSIDDFFSKVSEKLDKDNAHILQQQVCYLDDGSGDFFVDCSTPERKNAFVDKVIKGLEAMYNNKPKDSLPQTQKTGKISLSLDKRYLEEYHQPSSAKLTQMSTESEALSTTNIKTATNIEVDLITDMLDWIKNSPQSIYALLGDYGMGKTFSCRILSAKLTEEEWAIKGLFCLSFVFAVDCLWVYCCTLLLSL